MRLMNMQKPTLLLSAGIGWCATSPLRFTLQYTTNYTHTGWHKETHYLHAIDSGLHDRRKIISHLKEDSIDLQASHPTHYKELTNESTQLTYKDLGQYPVTIDKYINYFLAVHNDTKDHYHSVADFSNSNQFLSDDFFNKYLNVLNDTFDIKPFIILRDPVRRAWSECNNYFYNVSNCGYPNIESFFLDKIHRSCSRKYPEIILRWQKYFPNFQVFFMEDLWDNNNLSPLQDFFDYPFTTLYENIYSPDRGVNAPKDNIKLRDQWSSDHAVLTDKLYHHAYRLFEPVYNFFPELPHQWGHPLNYD